MGAQPTPVTLDGLVAALVAVAAGLSPLVGLAAVAAGGLLALAADGHAPLADAARRALGLGLGGLAALGAAHGLAALLGPFVAGA
jgi:hypothetical protein